MSGDEMCGMERNVRMTKLMVKIHKILHQLSPPTTRWSTKNSDGKFLGRSGRDFVAKGQNSSDLVSGTCIRTIQLPTSSSG